VERDPLGGPAVATFPILLDQPVDHRGRILTPVNVGIDPKRKSLAALGIIACD
jgi:hypothetical protein